MDLMQWPPEKFRKIEKDLREQLTKAGTECFFSALPKGVPSGETLENAARFAVQTVGEQLFPLLLSRLRGEELPEDERNALLLRMEDGAPPFVVPPLPLQEEPLPGRVALLAAAGALAGMAGLSPLTALFLGSREAGLLAGAPLGAFALTLAAFHLPRHPWVLRGLAALLGIATLRETIAFLGGDLLLSRGWSLLGRRRSSLTRLLLFPALMVLLLLAGKRTVRYDELQYREAFRRALSSWMDEAALVAALTAKLRPEGPRELPSQLPDLASKVLTLGTVPDSDLAPAVAELMEEVHNLGFRKESTEATFRWAPEMERSYAVFGSVEPGDMVTVEREPIFQGETLASRGVVRRIRS